MPLGTHSARLPCTNKATPALLPHLSLAALATFVCSHIPCGPHVHRKYIHIRRREGVQGTRLVSSALREGSKQGL